MGSVLIYTNLNPICASWLFAEWLCRKRFFKIHPCVFINISLLSPLRKGSQPTKTEAGEEKVFKIYRHLLIMSDEYFQFRWAKTVYVCLLFLSPPQDYFPQVETTPFQWSALKFRHILGAWGFYEHGGISVVQNLLWQMASVLVVSSETPPPIFVAFHERQDVLRTYMTGSISAWCFV